MQNRIFSIDDNPKANKARAYGYLNAIHYMAPYDLGGVGNLCPHATAGCKALCLGWTSGQAGMVKQQRHLNNVRRSRRDKAQRFMKDRGAYLADVIRSIELAQRKARKARKRLCVRMNGSTDIAWESVKTATGQTLPELFPRVQFVDYTKSPRRAIAQATGKFPANYSLCFSRSESNEQDCIAVLNAGGTVAIVIDGDKPATWQGFPTVDGDLHDLRHLDPRGHVVTLSPKGRIAKKDQSGFVIRKQGEL
jgi:hypothetical protein